MAGAHLEHRRRPCEASRGQADRPQRLEVELPPEQGHQLPEQRQAAPVVVAAPHGRLQPGDLVGVERPDVDPPGLGQLGDRPAGPPAATATSTHPGFLTPATYPTAGPPDSVANRSSPAPASENNGPVLLDEVAGTSAAVAASSARLAEVERLAACLRRLEPDEVHPAVAFLSGDLRQRQIGVGWAALRDAPDPASQPSLTVTEVDAAFERIGRLAGPGSQTERRRLVGELFGRATASEQRFLVGLLSGEPRQGALEGVMVGRPLGRAHGEVIALHPDGRPHPFQVTASRVGSRLEVERLAAALPLTVFLFDLLHLDGQDLLDRPGAERHRALAATVPEPLRIPRTVTADPAAAAAFLADTLARGHEGVMVKSLAATWEAGRRGAGWIKVKPVHTLDLVVLAAEWGHGRRRGWPSNLHLGARDPSGGFVMLGKTFKGLTDKLLTWQTERLLELAVGPTDGYVVHVRPELVVEIAFDGIQTSPRYPGGMALRFARVLRYRPDKRPEEADTSRRCAPSTPLDNRHSRISCISRNAIYRGGTTMAGWMLGEPASSPSTRWTGWWSTRRGGGQRGRRRRPAHPGGVGAGRAAAAGPQGGRDADHRR